MPVVPSEEISRREQFPLLCNERGVTQALEVGVDQAHFSRAFIEKFRGHMLYLVDPYLPYDNIPGARTANLMVAVQNMAPFFGRYQFFMLSSVEAAEQLPKWVNPGFVYIDANHEYNAVRMDIDAWWWRLPEDGILAGHDYDDAHPGVKKAVDEFAETLKINVYLTTDDAPASWYAYKTEPKHFTRLL